MPFPAQSRVLVVDDEEPIRDYLSAVLSIEGYDCRCFAESLAALQHLSSSGESADLMLADINMPGMNGIELLRQAKNVRPDMPVILVSGMYELALAMDALESGADDYLRKPVRPTDLVQLVAKYLSQELARQEEVVQHALRGFLESRERDPKTSEHLRDVFQKLGFKRYETFQHSRRVAAYSRLFGEACGLGPPLLDHFELGALLHDIGKIGIPRNVLLKPGKLTEDEWEVMRTHPTIGYRLMSKFEKLKEEAQLVWRHHEGYNGSGYPGGLAGAEIPLLARMFSLVDTWDAMTSDRPYRSALPYADARAEIERNIGRQFDPELAQQFLELRDESLDEIRRKYPDEEDGAG